MNKINGLKVLLIGSLFLIQSCSLAKASCSSACCKSTDELSFSNQEVFDVNEFNLDTLDQPIPLACTLKGQAQVERKEALKKEIFTQVNIIEETELGYVFKFDDQNGFLLKLIDYIIVEKECCPFFKYDFSIQPYNKGIELKVSGTEDVKDLLTMFVEEIQYERK